MREILFRGKRTDNKEWVYGYYFFGVCRSIEKAHYIFEPDGTFWEVDYETVGLYTGLTDKNGNKIFEGDVLKYHYKTTRKSPVVYQGGMFKAGDISLVTWVHGFTQCEVIGNIHDNPETLSGE